MTSENPDPSGVHGGGKPRTPQDWLRALGEAAAFFTCLPLPRTAWPFRAAAILPAWPVVGLAIGLAGGVDLAIARWLGAAPWLAAVVGLMTIVVLTAALHEDGLADTADALGAPGADRDRRLEILHDSRIGTYGALALGFSLLLRMAALTQIVAAAGTTAALMTLAAAHALSRAAIAWPLATSKPARSSGLGAASGTPQPMVAAWALMIGGGLAFLCLLAVSPLAALLAPPVAVALAAGASAVARNSLGGYTGDTLGAMQQVVEIAMLVLVALCVGGG
jgi:adenosylcobinamide-GDP ribazoletransferase